MNTVSEPLLRLQLIEIEILSYQFAKCFKKDIKIIHNANIKKLKK